ncbi:beta-ketoacyl synthase N-terminal-like domain-containing protein [Catelliglobosispora koreensis]|uniref:beta-ketoacyl synthase N-terminal-like domain-containing protein n=1 Tax=Catelliglobosispora koreensis TaxID=129052 RepID=UPI000360A775|nr:beta-ketoacyl synthase N-terminal-like domain-containing protein [Catelliglobosispora koreensis]
MKPITVTGWSVHLPGTDGACPPEQANTLLGRKGLLMKEPATRLALCAVHRALNMGTGERKDGPADPGTAVVASSNLGNVETVVDVVATVAADGGKAVSPMVAPNASSNVLSGTVAQWFKFGGPNLMLCSGRDSGAHALRLGALLLRSGRANRVIVVGAEPSDPVADRLYAKPLRAGAACLVLEHSDHGVSFSQAREHARGIAQTWGDCYGAQDIISVALAVSALHQEQPA